MSRFAFALMLLATPALAEPDLEKGRLFAEENCSGCHTLAATGESPNPASPPFRTLDDKYPIDHLEESFAEGFYVGHEGMPQFELEVDQIHDLLAFLKSIQE